jgi:type IV pilus assembly protein PilM
MIGIDIGNNNCKIALREGNGMRLISTRMPSNLVRTNEQGSEVASPETMAKFLKEVRAKEHVREKNCALVLAPGQVYFRHVTLPPMTVSELVLNLPYEFRDFVTGDPSSYVYDYAVEEMPVDEEGNLVRMELYAAAVSRELVETYANLLRKAGFKLKLVTPAPMAYMRLISEHAKTNPEDADKDTVLVDLGHADVTIALFRGQRYDSSRTIDFGCDEFDSIIADIKGIDPYTASNYKLTNFEGVLDDPMCLEMCQRFALEVSKVVNFYNFSNPEREIEQMYFLGGGARIKQLTEAISNAVSVPAVLIEQMMPPESRGQENSPVCALAVAGILEGESM